MDDRGTDIRDRLVQLYREIETTRMDGIPILNSALSVAAFGFEPRQGFHLGVLLTPWFMNLILVPESPNTYAKSAPNVGEKVLIALPAGQVEFIVGYEEDFGHILSCSLFSPMFEFADQEAAENTAQSALGEVLTPAKDNQSDPDADMRDIWAGRLPSAELTDDKAAAVMQNGSPSEVSRRDFLRGNSNARGQEHPV